MPRSGRRFLRSFALLLSSRAFHETGLSDAEPSRYVIDLGSCLEASGLQIVRLQADLDLPDVQEILLFSRHEHNMFRLLERWPFRGSGTIVHTLHKAFVHPVHCLGIKQRLSSSETSKQVGDPGRQLLSRARSRGPVLNFTKWTMTASGIGFRLQKVLPELGESSLKFGIDYVESCCSPKWTSYMEQQLQLVAGNTPAHPCVSSYGTSDGYTFNAIDIWNTFIQLVSYKDHSVGPALQNGMLHLRRVMDIVRFRVGRLAPDKGYDANQEEIRFACPALHHMAQRLNACHAIAPVLTFLSSDTEGPLLRDHLDGVLLANGFAEPGTLKVFASEHEGLSPAYATLEEAIFVRLEAEAERLLERIRHHARRESQRPWHAEGYYPSYWSDLILSRLSFLISSKVAALPLPPNQLLRQDFLITWQAITGDDGRAWEKAFLEVTSLIDSLQMERSFNWWPAGGNLLGFLRYGHVYGRLSEGVVDIVDDDIDIDIRAESISDIFFIALELSKRLYKEHRWPACWFTGYTSSVERFNWAAGQPFSRGPLTMTCYKIMYVKEWCKFQMDIHFYIIRAEDRSSQELPPTPSWGSVAVPVRTQATSSADKWLLVENEVIHNGRRYFMHSRRPPDASLIFPLGRCMVIWQFVQPGLVAAVPCPHDPVAYLKYSYESMVRGCWALPRVMKKRNLKDPRTRKLAEGITKADIDILRRNGAKFVNQGFKGFGPADFDECNVSKNPGDRYETLDCESSEQALKRDKGIIPACAEIKQYVDAARANKGLNEI